MFSVRSFVESRFADFDSAGPAAFICVHGCNELNMEAGRLVEDELNSSRFEMDPEGLGAKGSAHLAEGFQPTRTALASGSGPCAADASGLAGGALLPAPGPHRALGPLR